MKYVKPQIMARTITIVLFVIIVVSCKRTPLIASRAEELCVQGRRVFGYKQ
jgi:hypothetical protein